ncbi:DUF4426 domain-containing protein [Aestuariibacter sp. A3R04]|uniref:DUF4426 domain-containing protein n=1 Tax=Aestuariibacter sp. A3R04 TaxID=2841571 RepID=UPI001C088611|nr:DUF4426 domain-containing protein [Aestuariibacter sp. A3R04]MBU3021495.1 DUF4426 domain-containing protein [Aestuariibacter sp. A3R04]
MTYRPSYITWLMGCLLVLLNSHASAEQMEKLGKWDVHYIVVNTTFFTPEIAKRYGIIRSKYNAIVNISVLDSQTKKPLSTAVSGTARNLLGTTRPLAFKRITEQDAIYYIAPVSFNDRETFRFSIDIQQGNQTQTLKFQQEMFVD